MTRRTVGVATVGTLALLTGCADDTGSATALTTPPTAAPGTATASGSPTGSPSEAPPVTDEEHLQRALAAERDLVEQLTAASSVGTLASTVTTALTAHEAHAALLDGSTASAGSGSSGTGSPSTESPDTGSPGTGSPGAESPGTGSPGTSAPAPSATGRPLDPASTATALARAERALVEQHTDAAASVSSGPFARLLASMAAAAAQQAVVLERLARRLAAQDGP